MIFARSSRTEEWRDLSVSIILGTRPQIIKSAPVHHALRRAGVPCEIINTGQHFDYEMNREFFSELKLPDPAENLGVGKGTPSNQISQIISGLAKRFERHKPGLAMVPGDTNSALAAGVACSKAGVPIAHLEAGCRSGDPRMSEEVNRRLVDHMSQVLLCPTKLCAKNVRLERVLADVIANVGDTMYDSLLELMPLVKRVDIGSKFGVESGSYVFMTMHRAEGVDDPHVIGDVLAAVGSLAEKVLFSVHPRTRARMKEFGLEPGPNVRMLPPLPYVETLALVKGSKAVFTDSGGLQKEAYWLRKPTLILRDRTEWTEIVRAGASFVVGTSKKGILEGNRRMGGVDPKAFAKSRSIFGNGHASEKIVKVIGDYEKRALTSALARPSKPIAR